MAKQPVEFMFSPYRRQVLATLFLRPDERFHVRELERITGVSAGSLHRELRAMSESGAISARKGRKSGLLPSRCPLFNIRRTRRDFSQDDRADFVARRSLVGLRRQNSRRLRFRVNGQRPPKRGSDLDICVLGEVSLLEVVTALTAVQETLHREVNPVVMTTTKFSNLAAIDDRFVTRVFSEPKLFVKANEDELVELTAERPVRVPA